MENSDSSKKHEIADDTKKKQDCQAEIDELSSQPKLSEPNKQKSQISKNGEKHRSRRRKGTSKPRKIRQVDSRSGLNTNQSDEKAKSLNAVLQRVFKNKQVGEQPSENSTEETTDKMIDMHETLAIHHNHSPKSAVRVTTTPPGSVESESSLYSNERQEDNMSDNGSRTEPFVKVRPPSNGNISPDVAPSYDSPMQRSLSSDAVQRKDSFSPLQVASPKESQVRESRSFSTPHQSPASYANSSLAYDVMNGNQASAIAAMAAGMGLPPLLPSNAVMTSSLVAMQQQQQQFQQDSNTFSEGKNNMSDSVSFQTENNYTSGARGLARSSTGVSMTSVSPTPEERAQYKRPPHTYPALIASAILDSPGHLITLRGIYDYIMNHFPYYKYCHDKSAWQNSIRHNLSLNQCFVKVPRYENAAKSNYWTMTREGFEEFGNENSFKRRRRRGAALAPISAYKAKKYQTEAKHNAKNKSDVRHLSSENAPALSAASSEEGYAMQFPSQLMGFPAAWTSGFRSDEIRQAKNRKRSQSPINEKEAKQPRMLVLKQGDGPSLGGINTEEPKRPNSLSSVEEMQGTLNNFSKNFLDSSLLAKASRKVDVLPPSLLTTSAQPWITAAQKNLMATSGMFMPSLMNGDYSNASAGTTLLNNATSEEAYNNGSPVLMEGIAIGSEIIFRYENPALRQFRCRFCHYTYVGASENLLEQHARLLHQLEVTNAKAKAVAAAAVAKTQSERLADKPKEAAERLMSLQSMVSGLSPRSVFAAAQSNQSLLAAAQASVSSTSTGFPYSATFSSALLDESVVRSLAEQVGVGQTGAVHGEQGPSLPSVEAYAYQRQQALNNAIQQAAAASSSTATSQDQLRMLYQQLATMHNPFLSNTANNALAAVFPRQISTSEADQPNQFKQQLLQYQQKIFNQMKALNENGGDDGSSPMMRRSSNSDDAASSGQQESPCRSPDMDAELKKTTHQSQADNRTSAIASVSEGVAIANKRSPSHEASEKFLDKERNSDEKVSPISCEDRNNEHCNSPSSAFPTPPLSNSPFYIKRHSNALDLTAIRSGEDDSRRSPGAVASAATQTSPAKDDANENRTCRYCDIVFGDDMMHALHMSCHDKVDPFKCTICGQKCNEKYYFNLHLLRGLHQSNKAANKTDQSGDEFTNGDLTSSCRRLSNSSDSSTASGRGRLNSGLAETVTLH